MARPLPPPTGRRPAPSPQAGAPPASSSPPAKANRDARLRGKKKTGEVRMEKSNRMTGPGQSAAGPYCKASSPLSRGKLPENGHRSGGQPSFLPRTAAWRRNPTRVPIRRAFPPEHPLSPGDLGPISPAFPTPTQTGKARTGACCAAILHITNLVFIMRNDARRSPHFDLS